jgi:aspartate/methionine/tyrosine aminotransferase
LGRTRDIVRPNYALLRAWLTAHGGSFSHVPPRAGAIAWAGLRDGGDSARMAEDLRVRKRVLIVPGEQFEMKSYVRFGFGGDAEQLGRALARIAEWIEERALSVGQA